MIFLDFPSEFMKRANGWFWKTNKNTENDLTQKEIGKGDPDFQTRQRNKRNNLSYRLPSSN